MDVTKIGKFIAERRKMVNLTQMQLAEKLNITDRAISKWETGRAMPDSSIMLKLCEILKINVNDLLNGEVITVDNKEIEKLLVEMVKEKEESDKRMLKIEVIVGILSTLILIVPVFLGALLPIEEYQRLIIVFSGFIPALVGFFVCVKIEQTAGYYECQNCKHRYVPSFKAMNMAAHVGRKRRMTCPNCGEKSWQKKVIKK